MKLHALIATTTSCVTLLVGTAAFAGQDAPKKAPARDTLRPSARVYNISTGQFEEAPPYGPRRNSTRG